MKNIIRNIWLKVLVFVLAAGFLTFSVLQVQTWLYLDLSPQLLWTQTYEESLFEEDLNETLYSLSYFLETGDEDSIPADAEFDYRIERGEQILTNMDTDDPAYFKDLPKGHYELEDNRWVAKGNALDAVEIHYPSITSDAVVYVGFSANFFKNQEAGFQSQKSLAMELFRNAALGLGAFLVLLVFLLTVAGKKPDGDDIHLCFFDRIYSDLLLIPFVIVGFFWLAGMDALQTYGYRELILSARQKSYLILVGVLTFAAALAFGTLLLSWVRKGKKGNLLKHSLIYQVFHGSWSFFTSFLDGRRFQQFPLTKSLFYRQWIFIGASFMMVFLFLILLSTGPSLFWIPIATEGVLIYLYVKYNNKTYEAINLGFNESLEEQMKAERMKVALVTNVSHDLKTPLTSIISYTDLLSKEENLSENAKEYIQILSEKSNRLKKIVADLFDLAKSTTGNIQVNLESLDLKTLLQQAVADMDDEIRSSQATLRTSFPEEGAPILSDGNKLYRVIQNLMDNALKYSMPGTRIFLDLTTNQDESIVSLKNTAGYEMDFTKEEILQRFNRGDSSRTTEGSGLGLSIAESFTKVCGGDFDLEIDGDQFKITLRFPIRKTIDGSL
ncbi:HAMP domain-containing histidine kinase [Alkalibacter rhizosphaerae]|uniref:histidine kinase n=1 Tax=Alkalibacter rhizosphaerae TaxID=2815577 RepID=A0A975AIY0_9FIRM|nr:HAMP domain-containing sensor histidine kinase [Alkalibacter rhizosphaerae]QSX09010.1 HAMP domain-containing histidine kinase [Alkalibacter rhizosphaerae]